MESRQGRRPVPASLPHKLEALQRCGRAGPLFTAVPHSGLTPIEDVVDAAGDLKSVVLLGFTRDGAHLVSYTTQPVAATDGQEGYCLQLWSFTPGARCRRLWSAPLFRTQPYLDTLADEEEFMAADDMLVTVAEAPDSGLLVVHGRSSAAADGSSRDRMVNYLSLLPGPLHAGAAQLQVAHLAFHTAYPHTPFNPYHSLVLLEGCAAPGAASSSDDSLGTSGSSSHDGGGQLAVALFTGDSVQYVHVAVHRQAAQPLWPPPPQLRSPLSPAEADGEGDSSTSIFASPDAHAALAGAGASASPSPALSPAGQRALAQPPATAAQLQQQGASTPGGSPWPRRGPQRRWQQQQAQQRAAASPDGQAPELGVQYSLLGCTHAACTGSSAACQASGSDASGRGMAAVSCGSAPEQLDLEACLYATMQQRGLPPGDLLDYAAAPVQACSWQGRDGLLLLAVLRLVRQPAPAAVAQQGALPGGEQQQQPQQPHPSRSACVLVHAAAESGEGSVVEWLEPPYPWHDDLAAFLVQQTALAGLAFEKAPAFFADFMRTLWAVPPRRHRLPLVLTNRSVLGTGQSLQHIAHPWLPMVLLGYRGCR